MNGIIWNWKNVLLKARSVYVFYAVGIFGAVQLIDPQLLLDIGISPKAKAWILILAAILGPTLRVQYQPEVSAPPATDAAADKLVAQLPVAPDTTVEIVRK